MFDRGMQILQNNRKQVLLKDWTCGINSSKSQKWRKFPISEFKRNQQTKMKTICYKSTKCNTKKPFLGVYLNQLSDAVTLKTESETVFVP